MNNRKDLNKLIGLWHTTGTVIGDRTIVNETDKYEWLGDDFPGVADAEE
jgi:hypothetical protein